MRRPTKTLTILDANDSSLANYTMLKYEIDQEKYNVTNDTIVFNSLNNPYAFNVTYYGT